jgi:hypothetical protein
MTQKALLDLLRNAGVTVVMNVKHIFSLLALLVQMILTQKALLDLLRNAGVTVVMNVKHKVLATISAATGATIAQVA